MCSRVPSPSHFIDLIHFAVAISFIAPIFHKLIFSFSSVRLATKNPAPRSPPLHFPLSAMPYLNCPPPIPPPQLPIFSPASRLRVLLDETRLHSDRLTHSRVHLRRRRLRHQIPQSGLVGEQRGAPAGRVDARAGRRRQQDVIAGCEPVGRVRVAIERGAVGDE